MDTVDSSSPSKDRFVVFIIFFAHSKHNNSDDGWNIINQSFATR